MLWPEFPTDDGCFSHDGVGGDVCYGVGVSDDVGDGVCYGVGDSVGPYKQHNQNNFVILFHHQTSLGLGVSLMTAH